jgi:hypothetical protein
MPKNWSEYKENSSKEFPMMTVNRSEIINSFGFRWAQGFKDKVEKRVHSMTDEEMEDFASKLREEYVDKLFFESIKRIFIKHFM